MYEASQAQESSRHGLKSFVRNDGTPKGITLKKDGLKWKICAVYKFGAETETRKWSPSYYRSELAKHVPEFLTSLRRAGAQLTEGEMMYIVKNWDLIEKRYKLFD